MGEGGVFRPLLPKAPSSVAGPISAQRTQTIHHSSTAPISSITASSQQSSLRVSTLTIISVQQQITSSPLPSSTHPITKAATAGGSVPNVALIVLAIGLCFIGVIVTGLVWLWQRRKRMRHRAVVANSFRARELRSDDDDPNARRNRYRRPISRIRSWTSPPGNAPSHRTHLRTLQPTTLRPNPHQSILAGQRASPPNDFFHFDAWRDNIRNNDADRHAPFNVLSGTGGINRTHKAAANDDAQAKSPDSGSNTDRHGSTVNRDYKTYGGKRSKQKAAQRYSSQAMAPSDDAYGDDEADGPYNHRPLFVDSHSGSTISSSYSQVSVDNGGASRCEESRLRGIPRFVPSISSTLNLESRTARAVPSSCKNTLAQPSYATIYGAASANQVDERLSISEQSSKKTKVASNAVSNTRTNLTTTGCATPSEADLDEAFLLVLPSTTYVPERRTRNPNLARAN
ncbi:MAG: hypothetical protein M4579_005843 [Chaenotheca gracillima]|nr:MAG: hypothetical protein M4579_005843 [Chaenotheca gracillima]